MFSLSAERKCFPPLGSEVHYEKPRSYPTALEIDQFSVVFSDPQYKLPDGSLSIIGISTLFPEVDATDSSRVLQHLDQLLADTRQMCVCTFFALLALQADLKLYQLETEINKLRDKQRGALQLDSIKTKKLPEMIEAITNFLSVRKDADNLLVKYSSQSQSP